MCIFHAEIERGQSDQKQSILLAALVQIKIKKCVADFHVLQIFFFVLQIFIKTCSSAVHI